MIVCTTDCRRFAGLFGSALRHNRRVTGPAKIHTVTVITSTVATSVPAELEEAVASCAVAGLAGEGRFEGEGPGTALAGGTIA